MTTANSYQNTITWPDMARIRAAEIVMAANLDLKYVVVKEDLEWVQVVCTSKLWDEVRRHPDNQWQTVYLNNQGIRDCVTGNISKPLFTFLVLKWV